ncbi:MAG: hypothetical protein ABIP11_00945 [Luteimonas sp.]
MKSLIVVVTTIALANTVFSTPVHAANRWSNAVESCQGALPNFEGALRKRPLAIDNEGTSAAFVTCSMAADLGSPSGVTGVAALFTNRTGGAVTVNCTLISGIVGTAIYLPKAIAIAANGQVIASWDSASDNGGHAFLLANLSCALPVGTEINVVQTNFT